MVRRRATASKSPKEIECDAKDVEERGRPQRDRKYRFRDNQELEPDDQRRVEFKKKLLDSVENAEMERFRKSGEEVCFFRSLGEAFY